MKPEEIKEGKTKIDSRVHLLAFVTLKHFEQKRKYTNEPYLNHLKSVANMADGKCRFGYETGLCHDLLEDTDCTPAELGEALYRFGYGKDEVVLIVGAVMELTDVFTSESYPDVNRKNRKHLEALRLHNVSHEAQTVKYCDLIDNTSSIVTHDHGFAEVYLKEKESILAGMNKGNPELYQQCLLTLAAAKEKLANNQNVKA